MSKFTSRLHKALLEELQGKFAAGDPNMDTPDGKGVADKKEEAVKVSTKVTETEIDLDGKNDCVDKDIPTKAPSDGAPAAGDPTIESPTGAGVVDQSVKKSDGAGDTSKTSAASMESADGNGLADKSVNTMESFILPHDIVVEQNGKIITLKQGTRVGLLKEDVPEFLKDQDETEETKTEPAPTEETESELGDEINNSDIPSNELSNKEVTDNSAKEQEDISAIDKIVLGMEMTLEGYKAFAAEEKTEEAHQE